MQNIIDQGYNEKMTESMMHVFSDELDKRIQEKLEQGVTVDRSTREAYAEASGLGFQNGKFYELDENGNIDTDQQVAIASEILEKYQATREIVKELENTKITPEFEQRA